MASIEKRSLIPFIASDVKQQTFLLFHTAKMSQTLTEAPMPVPVGVSIDHSGESDPNAVVPGQPADQLELDEDPSLESARATEDESKYPTGTKLWLIIISIALVLIVATMDSSIVAVAVPAMTDEWHTTADVGWYMAAFRLCTCSFQFSE